MGGGGIYYRATLGRDGTRPRRNGAEPNITPIPPRERDLLPSRDAGVGPMREIESGSVLAMADETAGELLAELNAKHAKGRTALWAAGLAAVGLVVVLAAKLPAALVSGSVVVGLIGVFLAKWNDDLQKTTVIAFELDDVATKEFESLVEALRTLGSAQRLWHVGAEGDVYDRKRNAGASTVVNRSDTRLGLGLPTFVRSNLDTRGPTCPTIARGE